MKIKRLELGILDTNCYLVTDEETRETFIIDPADDEDVIENVIDNQKLEVRGILLTHGHFDHIYAASALAQRFHIPICIGENESELISDIYLNSSAMTRREVTLTADVLLRDMETLKLGAYTFTVISTPGHTKGSVCYYCESELVLFSGDTLFFESVGNTELPTGNYSSLEQSIRTRLYNLDNNVLVYPGHGPRTSIGYELINNPYVRP